MSTRINQEFLLQKNRELSTNFIKLSKWGHWDFAYVLLTMFFSSLSSISFTKKCL